MPPIDTHVSIRAFKEKISGQDALIRQFVHLYAEHRKHLESVPNCPPLFCLLVGPPGVGKTYFAKVAAEVPFECDKSLFQSEKNIVEINLANMPRQAVELQRTLFGCPPFYMNAQPGVLTGPLARNPNRIVLFDEVHLTCGDFWDLLVSISNGYLFDNYMGQNTNVSNAVMLAASNYYCDEILQLDDALQAEFHAQYGDAIDDKLVMGRRKDRVLNYLAGKNIIPRPFFPRISAVFVFRPLSVEDGATMLASLIDAEAEKLGIAITHDEGYDRVLTAGFLASFVDHSDAQKPNVNGHNIRCFFEETTKYHLHDFLLDVAPTPSQRIRIDWDEAAQQTVVILEEPSETP